MPSAWIQHVKKVASQKGITYGEALKIASKTYKKGKQFSGGSIEDMSPAEKKMYTNIQSFLRNLPALSNQERRRLDDLISAPSSPQRLEGLRSFLAILSERLQRQNEEMLAEWNNNQQQFPSSSTQFPSTPFPFTRLS